MPVLATLDPTMPRRPPDPRETRAALAAVAGWVDGTAEQPPRPQLAAAVRTSLRTLSHVAPGHAVEVRVPPYGAVQCVEGPRHTRGTPPNVVETDARTWLALALGRTGFDDAVAAGHLRVSGHRASDIARWLPVGVAHPSGDEG
jgi:hypothetical protein